MKFKPLSRKIYLELPCPTEADNRSAQARILDGLHEKGYDAKMSVRVLRQLYPLLSETECEAEDEAECEVAGGTECEIEAECKAARRNIYRLTASLAWNGYGWEVVRLDAGDTHLAHYGLAADLGSTTLVIQLYNCESGEMIAEESAYSRQIHYGEDILSRIFYAKDNPDHLEEIRRATTDTFSDVYQALKDRTGIDCRDCISMTVAGNTTMIHFLIGMDPFCVFQTPYAVRADQPGFMRASDLDLALPGFVFCFPSKANYLGGDIISGMLAVDFCHNEHISLFFDVGTNGELVIGNRDFLLCGAGAAGPALEGGVVRTGMRAAHGAIESIHLIDNNRFDYSVIGGGTAKGICGSGIVDLISELFIHGWISIQGRLQKGASCLIVSKRYIDVLMSAENKSENNICGRSDGENINVSNCDIDMSNNDICMDDRDMEMDELCVEYAPGLYFWQSDIDEFIRTKAAAATMMGYMMSESGLTVDEVDRFYMAGAFGTHIDKEAAVNIGMYPDVDRDRIIPASNTSLAGAAKLLLHKDALEDLDRILGLMTYVQFGAVDDFLIRMKAAQALPHTDIEMYPSVIRRLKENGVM